MEITQKHIFNIHSYSRIFLILGIIILINFLGARYFLRFDLTEDRQFTVSKATRDIVSHVDDLVTIKVYFSQKLPPNLLPISNYVRDLLSEYRAFSNGNIQVEYIDPLSDPLLEQEVRMLGIPQIQMNVVEKDKIQVQNGYLGIALFYVDKQEVLPLVSDTQNLEYELTSAIKKVTATETKTIGFLTGHGEYAIYDSATEKVQYEAFRTGLEKNYTLRMVNVSKGDPIVDVDTLIVAGPKEAIFERDIFEIDQFMMNGGNVIFLVDTVDIGDGLQASPLQNEQLTAFLNNLGVRVEQNLVLDVNHETASFSQGFVQFILPYPFWPKLLSLSESNPVVSKLDSIVMPWASSISVTAKEGISSEILAQTSDQAWSQSGEFRLDPNQRFMVPSDARLFDMALLLTGNFQSSFSGKNIPPITQPENIDVTKEVQVSDTALDRTVKDSTDSEIRVAVVGDAGFISDIFAGQFPQNLDFALNLVDYITLDDALIGIRSKGITDRPLSYFESEAATDRAKSLSKFFGILGMAIVVCIYGVIRLVRRRRSS